MGGDEGWREWVEGMDIWTSHHSYTITMCNDTFPLCVTHRVWKESVLPVPCGVHRKSHPCGVPTHISDGGPGDWIKVCGWYGNGGRGCGFNNHWSVCLKGSRTSQQCSWGQHRQTTPWPYLIY